MNFLIVTGLSGAGKSMAVNALEDIGFFCIDNIPVALLPRIVDFALQGENQLNRVAVVMDVRGVRSIEKLQEALADLDEKKIDYDILFLDANDAAIQRRYKETRRKHPLMEKGMSMTAAIEKEREMLSGLRDRADFVVDKIKKSGAQGLVLFMQQFCDPEEMEYPYLKKALDAAGIPHIKLGVDQQMRDFGQASTAIQAFADVL